MNYSIATIIVGFLIAWLGVVLVFLSLRADPSELNRMHLGFLSKPFAKANDSRKKIKILIIIGITVTAILYAASWMGLIAW